MSTLAHAVDGPVGAPVLVLLSSLGTTHEMWHPQVADLGRTWRLLRIDHPGHGESPVWDGEVTVADIGGAILHILDSLDLDRVHACGLSLGGAICQWLAVHAPERVERLILCSTAARFEPAETYLQRARTVRSQGMAEVAASVMERWFTPDFREREPAAVDGYRAMVAAIPPEGYAQCCEAVAAFDGRAGLSRIQAPTLVISARDDPATTVEQGERLRDGIPGARLEVIPDAAHLVNVEQPEAVTAAIRRHLEGDDNGR